MEMNVRRETGETKPMFCLTIFLQENPTLPRATGLLCSFSFSQLTIYKRIYCLSVVTEKTNKVSKKIIYFYFIFFLSVSFPGK